MTTPYTVLCVDDEALGLQIRRALLEMAGFKVLTALDGKSALVIFEDHTIHAVLLDYIMPGMDGGRVAAAMRTIKPTVPILLHSACVDLPQETIELVDATLPKGEGPESLISRLQLLIDASHSSVRSNR
ncbi:response regulator [Alloacidobacterium dinghuense]|uniref:Response regulator n=1 Tax=Alloacidobacterium dinghuense TaxID=2763107 RepID=A0A7G8BNQ6_9BACT|nr:response regulator [Alloacidobacterium dinghuense]QNI34176.1 response regulator [Alloacidobacterium dinghuense]